MEEENESFRETLVEEVFIEVMLIHVSTVNGSFVLPGFSRRDSDLEEEKKWFGDCESYGSE